MHLNGPRRAEVVVCGGPVPALAVDPRSQAKKPPAVLYALGYHLCEVPHHPSQVAAADAGDKLGSTSSPGSHWSTRHAASLRSRIVPSRVRARRGTCALTSHGSDQVGIVWPNRSPSASNKNAVTCGRGLPAGSNARPSSIGAEQVNRCIEPPSTSTATSYCSPGRATTSNSIVNDRPPVPSTS